MSLSSFLCMLSRETLRGGRRSRGMQRITNFRALCSLPRKWQQSSLLSAPPRPAWDPGFTHQRSSVSAPRPYEYSTPMFSPALSESSLDYDSEPACCLIGVGLDAGLPCVAPPRIGRGKTHFHSLLCLEEASRLGQPFSNKQQGTVQ